MKHHLTTEEVQTACAEYVARRFYPKGEVTLRATLCYVAPEVGGSVVKIDPPTAEVEVTSR